MKNLWDKIRSWFRKSKTVSSDSTHGGIPVGAPEPSAAKVVRLTIGLDWGTSCTKCIVRDRYGQGDPAYVIDFGEVGFSDASHLLPSRFLLTCGDSRTISLSNTDETTEIIDETKLALLNQSLDPNQVKDHQTRAVLYLAHAISLIFKNWNKEWGNLYTGLIPRWSLNVGIPAARIDDSHIVKRFKEVAIAAWKLVEETGDNMNLQSAKNALSYIIQNNEMPHPNINVVPEVAAQVATYAQSSFRRDGLHALVDVGAATIDTAMFILMQNNDGEDVYSILSAKVDSYGAYRLHTNRINALQDNLGEQLNSPNPSTIHIVPNEYKFYCPDDLTKAIKSLLSDVDQKFQSLARISMHYPVDSVRKNMYPNAPAWERGLPFFTCGGGSHIDVYKRARLDLSYLVHKITPGDTVAPFTFLNLQCPDNLRWKNDAGDFDRLSVAYGLSLPFVELGKVRSPGEIAPVPKLDGPGPRRFDNEDSKDWD